MRSLRAAAFVPLAALALAANASAQTGHTPYDSAYHAWDRGDYVDALQRMQRMLNGPEAERVLEPVALLTGELFHTWSLTEDGRAPRWSPDGRWFVYETGAGSGREIRVMELAADGPRQLATVAGWNAAPGPDGRLAYLRPGDAPELRAARAEVERMRRAGEPAAALRRQQTAVDRLERVHARITVREVHSGRESERPAPGLASGNLVFLGDGTLLLFGGPADDETSNTQVYRLAERGAPTPLTSGQGARSNPAALAGNRVVYGMDAVRFAILDAAGDERVVTGAVPSASRGGDWLTFLRRDGGNVEIRLLRADEPGEGRVVLRTTQSLANPAVSPDGRRVAYQQMVREDWEIFLIDADGGSERRLTREIQHDISPQFLSGDRVLAVMGEGRHRRSYLYDITPESVTRRRLFHNNTVRTVAPEYAWVASPDGSKVLFWADRDGDTVSPERGVYLMDLGRRVTRQELLARVEHELAAEQALRARGEQMYAPIADRVRAMAADVSVGRIYEYANDLYQFDSKNIARPGNRMAIEYLEGLLRSWGYDVELEWFEPRPGIRTANVVVTLRGTVDPELMYVAGSHFDSVERGPGADDNSSGTTALLEVARVLRDRPQPATIRMVWFTGEESGLLGAREFARRAVTRGDRVLGALNNDMIGWTRSHRLDNTIRYSNRGLRDVQHAAAFLFSDLITYDSRYYQSTDAHALFDAFGDVISGIGSYPILGNPHYHQTHDVLETINQQLVAEVAKTTAATLMLMASSPGPVQGLEVAARRGDGVDLRWTAAPETGVTGYEVRWLAADGRQLGSATVGSPAASLHGVPAGATVQVRALRADGTHGWDWADVTLER
jgi:hypothetical protein